MPQQKVDYHKINSLKAKVYDTLIIIEELKATINKEQQKIEVFQKEIREEEAKKV